MSPPGNVTAVALSIEGANSPKNTLPVHPATGRHRLALKSARAFCEALFSTAEGPPPADRMDWLIGELDLLLDRAGWRSGGFYKTTLILVNLLSPLFIGVPMPLWSLTMEERIRALTKLEQSPLAAIVLAAKSIICIIYYEHPDSAKEIGFARKCHTGGAR